LSSHLQEKRLTRTNWPANLALLMFTGGGKYTERTRGLADNAIGYIVGDDCTS
jgi:hypothetical protein